MQQNQFAYCLLLCLLTAFAHNQALYAQSLAPDALKIGSHERLWVPAPHPDDERLSSAGLYSAYKITEAVTSGDAFVRAVITTTGRSNPIPADYLAYGEQRASEYRQAAQILDNVLIYIDLVEFSDSSIYPALINH